jgi:hypothetical protein
MAYLSNNKIHFESPDEQACHQVFHNQFARINMHAVLNLATIGSFSSDIKS